MMVALCTPKIKKGGPLPWMRLQPSRIPNVPPPLFSNHSDGITENFLLWYLLTDTGFLRYTIIIWNFCFTIVRDKKEGRIRWI